ncbi:MAG: metallophosphoesterase [Mediterranea sp.]|nr:metallophosphoesterase [Mediterranea sp.]
MKQIKHILLVALLCTVSAATAQPTSYTVFKDKFNFYVANDLGRNGYYDQKPIAERMGVMAEEIDPEFVAAPGDIHHFDGVRSVSDPLWMTNYELIYSHPELMIAWHPVLGNHEYRGNTQAVLDYAQVSRRWEMPARYYTKIYAAYGTTLRLVWLDTTPMMDKYRNDSLTYPDACRQDLDRQLAWTDSVLTVASEQWVIVLGHHPIYAQTKKEETERTDMQRRLDPILRSHKVDMYVCGHIHNFQHIRKTGSDIDYVVNSSASLSRKVNPIDGTRFCSSEAGFSIISADAETLCLRMIDKEGKVLYTITRKHK